MADEQPRGCGGRRGGRVRGQPRRGVDDGEEVPQPHPARLDVHRDINHEVDSVSNSDDGEDEGLDTDSGSKPHPDEFIDWLHTVERVFDIKNLNGEQKVKLVAIKLKKNASMWWEHVKKQRVREGKPKIL
ncbi:hypothetical protein Tco_1549972, partial [Tanacetum coccineum]